MTPDAGSAGHVNPTPIDLPTATEAIRGIAFEVGEELRRPGGPSDFSAAGARELVNVNAEHLRTVSLEAIKMARQDHLDSVSAQHVRQAQDDLRPRRSPPAWHITGVISGILCGLGLQEFVDAMESAEDRTAIHIAILTILLVLGCSGLVASFVVVFKRDR
ncbi:hypothetical protein [Actinoplanes aureus]|uniref:DUF2335 domain-containing protein n=1 Tax=Actinoplanes aureus TaxID=2792083 RepID=A0A931FX84_9ACTN|nr:hypothetical protein [Actinoplanes aureus]MBG0562200.1 hypothetical protein [Actinoplanes aureus]